MQTDKAVLMGAAATLLAICFISCSRETGASGLYPASHVSASAEVPAEVLIRVPPPPLSDETFPCSDCHDPELPVKTKRRVLKLSHGEIELHHAEENRWCLDCHDTGDRDMLRLANGDLVPFEESYRLCGQCHGEKLRDWRVGIHGRRTGSWNGEKTYLLCVHCHDSHAPKFKPLVPLSPPTRPEVTR